MLKLEDFFPSTHLPVESASVRAARLRERMHRFRNLYNAAWFVRAAQHGSPQRLQEKIACLMSVLRRELKSCKDDEALLYAIADALTTNSRLPWED